MFRTFGRFFSTTASAAKNAKVFFDINIEGAPAGRIVFEVPFFFIKNKIIFIVWFSFLLQLFQKLLKISEDFALETLFHRFPKKLFILKVSPKNSQ